jgi:hypothetical protein
MRRVLAILLMLAFGLPLIAPALAFGPDDSQLPACCRRNGAHHCAMMSEVSVNASRRLTTVSGRCPCPPITRLALMLPHALSTQHNSASVTWIIGQPAIIREAEAGYRISFHRSRQKRGPPQLAIL